MLGGLPSTCPQLQVCVLFLLLMLLLLPCASCVNRRVHGRHLLRDLVLAACVFDARCSDSFLLICCLLPKGMSTCLGALIVFCHPIDDGDDADDERVDLADGTAHKKMSGRRKVSPSTMAFSLALAGSVMVTVSVVSIGPECLAASSMHQNSKNSGLDEENSFFVFGITLMPVFSWAFLHRLLSFVLGWFSYYLMSRYAFPEPEEILSTHFESVRKSSLPDCDKDSGDELDNQSTNANNSPPHKNGSLQRRGSSTEDVELATKLNGGVHRKGLFRTHPTERMKCCSFATCLSSLRVFMRGSELNTSEARRANRVAMLLFFSLLLHNFPEGLAVAASALESDKLGMTVTIGLFSTIVPAFC
jgi:zinc transporter ZupT